MSDNNNKKHFLYNLFSGTNNRSGKGLSKAEVERDKNLGFAYFFKLLKSRLGKFSGSNLIFSLCNLPFFIAFVGFIGTFDNVVNTASSPLYGPILGAMQYESNPVIATLKGTLGVGTELRVTSTVSRIFMYCALLLIITFGLSTIGLVYNIRNVCTGETVDTWRDFFHAIKRNFKQGIIVGVIDAVVIALLGYDIVAYGANADNSFTMLVLYYASIVFSAIYYIMRYYVYIQLVTCKMSVGKMFKNSFLLTALGIKRNLVALLGSIAFIVLFIYLYILLPSFSMIFFTVFVFAFLTYIGVYCAYPVVNKYVIEPYYEEHPEERPGYGEDNYDEDPIFTDKE